MGHCPLSIAMLNNQRVPTGRGEGTDLDHETPGPLKSHFPICDKTVQPFPHQILGAGSPNIVAGLSILIYIYIKHIYIYQYIINVLFKNIYQTWFHHLGLSENDVPLIQWFIYHHFSQLKIAITEGIPHLKTPYFNSHFFSFNTQPLPKTEAKNLFAHQSVVSIW